MNYVCIVLSRVSELVLFKIVFCFLAGNQYIDTQQDHLIIVIIVGTHISKTINTVLSESH